MIYVLLLLYICVCMCPYIIEVKRVYDVYQYMFSKRESIRWVSIIYSLSTPPHSDNTHSLIERVCVEHPSYILSALPLVLSYRWKNVIRIEGIDYASNEVLSWQGLGEDVSHVEACRYMMYRVRTCTCGCMSKTYDMNLCQNTSRHSLSISRQMWSRMKTRLRSGRLRRRWW